MYVIPAIDLVEGECVRLIQGDYNRQITYQHSPIKQAKAFIEAGAKWLHIVDLDGARIGKPINTDAIAGIIALGKLKVEVGGGIREETSIKQLLEIGAERVIIGTRALGEFEWFSQMTEKFHGRIVLSLDARGSKVATHGWTEKNSHSLMDFAVQASKLPLAAIIYTDINRDGMLSGPNLERTKALAEAVKVPLIVAGGIREISDIEKLMELGGIEAVIVGRALYERTLDLSDAIRATRQPL